MPAFDPPLSFGGDLWMTAVQRLEPVAGCGCTLAAWHQAVIWAWSHARFRMLVVWGTAVIGLHQPRWRGATDRFRVNWTGASDPELTVVHVPQCGQSTPPAYEKTYPIDVHLLGAEAIVQVLNPLAPLVQYPGGLQRRTAGFHGIFITGHNPACRATSQAASHFQEEYMANLWSRAQVIEQFLLWTLR